MGEDFDYFQHGFASKGTSFIQQREIIEHNSWLTAAQSGCSCQGEQGNTDLQGQKIDSESKEVERKGTFHLGKVDSFLCCQFLCQGTDHDPSFVGWPRRGGCWSRSSSSSRLGRRRSSCRSCHRLNEESKPSVEGTAREPAHLIINQDIITDLHKGFQRQKLNQKLTGRRSAELLGYTPNKIKNLCSPFSRNQNWHKQQAGKKIVMKETCCRFW